MSHYTVAVFTDGTRDVDELLAPYDEDIEVDPYICRTKSEMIRDAKNKAERYRSGIASGEMEISPYMAPYLNAQSDAELYLAERDADSEYDEDGNELSTYNPDSKWDWYQIGGRWDDSFAEYGIRCDGTRVGDIRSTYDPEKYQDAVRFWELYIDGDNPRNEEEKKRMDRVFYRREFYTERYGNKDTYAQCMAGFHTFAVVTPDGVWHEPGQMGWFGCSGESPEEGRDWELNYIRDFIQSADPDWIMTLVDCHI